MKSNSVGGSLTYYPLSLSPGSTYTNTTGKGVIISVTSIGSDRGTVTFHVNNVAKGECYNSNGSGIESDSCFFIKAGGTFMYRTSGKMRLSYMSIIR